MNFATAYPMKIKALGLVVLSLGLFSGCSTLQKGAAFYQAEWAKGETEFQRAAKYKDYPSTFAKDVHPYVESGDPQRSMYNPPPVVNPDRPGRGPF